MHQDTIKVQPLIKNIFPDGFPDVSVETDGSPEAVDINRYSSKILVFTRDGSERVGDPSDSPWSGRPKNRVFEPRRFREVERGRYRINWKKKLLPCGADA